MTNKARTLSSLIAIIGLAISVNASAAIIKGDFLTASDLPYSSFANYLGALLYGKVDASVGPGVELTNADFIENPSDWLGGVVNMDLDPTTNILTLSSQDTLDFQTFDASISNIVFDAGEVITGLFLLSGNITDPGLLPLLEFGNNSIHIRYDIGPGNDTFFFTGTQAQFKITTSLTAAPLPGAAWLFGSGLIGLLGLRKKKIGS